MASLAGGRDGKAKVDADGDSNSVSTVCPGCRLLRASRLPESLLAPLQQAKTAGCTHTHTWLGRHGSCDVGESAVCGGQGVVCSEGVGGSRRSDSPCANG